MGVTRILPATPESLPAIQLEVPVPQSDIPVPATQSDVPVPAAWSDVPVPVSPLPPDCTYASNDTIVCKQDPKIFERALMNYLFHALRAFLREGNCLGP